MSFTPFAVNSYTSPALSLSAQRVVNARTVKAQPRARTQTPVFRCPGIKGFTTFAAPVRGASLVGDSLVVVAGNTAYRVSSSGVLTALGSVPGVGPCAAAAGVDGCVTAFQCPTGSTTQTPRNLVIRGIRIDSVNIGAAVATTASVLQWSLAFGATGGSIPSLAQAESGSFTTATAKAWRRVPLGLQSWIVGAAIGAPAEAIVLKFDAPVVVHPGQWVAAVAKFIVGTATASQVIWATVTFDAYYE